MSRGQQLKQYFQTGDRPSQSQFEQLINECIRVDSDFDRCVGWTGGVVSLSDDDELQINTNTTGMKGGQFSGLDMIQGDWYQVEVDVASITGPWILQDEWGANHDISKNLAVGMNVIVFQKKTGDVVIGSSQSGSVIKIEEIRVSRLPNGDPEVLAGLAGEVNSLQAIVEGVRYFSDFDGNVTGWDGKLFPNNQTIVSTNGNLVVTKTVTGTSAFDCRSLPGLGFPMPNGTDYDITINVVSLTGSWELRNRFSAFQQSLGLVVGENKLTVTRNDANGYYPIVVGLPGTVGEQITISDITVQESGTGLSLDLIQDQIDAAIDEHAGILAFTDFETDEGGWDGYLFATNQSHTVANDQLTITKLANGTSASVDCRNAGVTFEEGRNYEIIFDVVSLQGGWVVQDRFSGPGAVRELQVGRNVLSFTRLPTNGQFPAIIGRNGDGVNTGDSVVLNEITIKEAQAVGFNDNLEYVWIGQGAENTVSSATTVKGGVVIGARAETNQNNPVVIGNDANGVHVPAYGALGIHGCETDNEMVIVGNLAAGGGWRTTSIGAKAYALGQSSTAVGTGAIALASHGVAIGRGSWVPDQSHMNFVTVVLGGQNLYMENAWGHQFNTPYSGIGVGSKVPSNVVNEYHGQDAFDARYPEWSASTNYTRASTSALTAHVIQHNAVAYKSLSPSGPSQGGAVEPGVTAGWESTWRKLYDIVVSGTAGPGGPTDFNVDGGHSRLIVGRATGSGTSGTTGLSVTNGNNNGPNSKKTVVEGFYVDSDMGNANTNMCFRRNDGQEFRINMEADGTLKAITRTALNLTYECNGQ